MLMRWKETEDWSWTIGSDMDEERIFKRIGGRD